MTDGAEPGRDVLLETARLSLRPWRVTDAAFQREMWLERDPRVPPHRRIDADGHPTITDIEESIRGAGPRSAGLLVVERKDEGDALGF
jgi:ribosomal-protein-alanine N-acetyltransferase